MPKLDLKTELISLPTDPAFLEAKNADFKNINQDEENSAKKIQKLSDADFVEKFGNYFEIMSFLDNFIKECWGNLQFEQEQTSIVNNVLKKLNNPNLNKSESFYKNCQTKDVLIKFFQGFKTQNNSSSQTCPKQTQPKNNFSDHTEIKKAKKLNSQISQMFKEDFQKAVLSLYDIFQENSEILNEIHLGNAIFSLGKKDKKKSNPKEQMIANSEKKFFFRKNQRYFKQLFDCLTPIIQGLYFGHQSLGNFGYGLQNFSDNVLSKELLDDLGKKISNVKLSSKEIGFFGYGLQKLSDKVVSKELMEELRKQMLKNQLIPNDIRYFSYGLKNLSDKVVSRELMEELRKQIANAELQYTEISDIVRNLKNLSDKVVSKEFLEEIKKQMENTNLSPQSVGDFGYGLQNLSDAVVSRELMEELRKQMSMVKLSPKDVRQFSYGLKKLSDKVVSKELMEELRKQMLKMRLSSNSVTLSPQGIGNFGYGLQSLSEKVISKELLEELQKQMKNKQLTPQGIGNFGYGLQNLSDEVVSPELLEELKKQITKVELNPQAIGNFLYGINGLKSKKAQEIRKFLEQKTTEIPNDEFEEKGLIALMQGFTINDLTPPKNLQSAYEAFVLEKTNNNDFINQKEESAWNILSPKFNDLKHNTYYNGFELDFYSPEKKLNIELDGCYHNQRKDAKRDCYLKKQGIQVIRISLLSEDWQAQLAQIS